MERIWDETLNIAIREALAPAVPVINRLTHLGDGPVLIAMAIWIYWFGGLDSRRERAFVIAIGIAAFALSVGIKGIVGLERPDLAFAPPDYPGYTFPSAHALGAAAFYGALAVTIKRRSRWLRYSLAGLAIVAVALSRVTLGVHYVGDVIVGVLLGLGLVWIGLYWRRAGEFRPGVVFLFATAIAIVTVALGSRQFVSLVIGAGAGGAAGWYWVKDKPITESGAAIFVTGSSAFVGLSGVAVIPFLVGVPTPGVPDPLWFIAEMVAYFLIVAFVMALPAIAVLVEDNPRVRWLQRVLPFQRRRVQFDAVDQDGPISDN